MKIQGYFGVGVALFLLMISTPNLAISADLNLMAPLRPVVMGGITTFVPAPYTVEVQDTDRNISTIRNNNSYTARIKYRAWGEDGVCKPEALSGNLGIVNIPWDMSHCQRDFIVWPALSDDGNPKENSPVVFWFHGRGGIITLEEKARKFHDLWPGATIVYPAGTVYGTFANQVVNGGAGVRAPRGWMNRGPYTRDDCEEVGIKNPYYICEYSNMRDQEMIAIILAWLKENHNIDSNYVFASGYSSGGFFTLSLTELMPEVFAAFAPFSAFSDFAKYHKTDRANLTPPVVSAAETPKPVFYIVGNNDTTLAGNRPYPYIFGTQIKNPNPMNNFLLTLDQLLHRARVFDETTINSYVFSRAKDWSQYWDQSLMFSKKRQSQVTYSRHFESNNRGSGHFFPSYGDEVVIAYFKYLFDNQTDVIETDGQAYLTCIVNSQVLGPCSL